MFRTKLLSTVLCPVVIAATPLPVFAQDAQPATGTCGQPAALTQKMPEALTPDFSEMTLVTRPLRSEPTYVEFEVTEALDMTMQTIGRGIDTVLTLYDANGRMLTWDDDGAGDLDPQIGTTLQPGTYCAQVRLISAEPVQDAMVIVLASSGLPPDPMAAQNQLLAQSCADPNLSPALAEGVAGGEQQAMSGSLSMSVTSQAYRFTVASPVTVQIDASSPVFDTMLSVHDAEGNLLFENDDHPEMSGSDSRVSETFQPGEYCAVVRPYSSGEGQFGVELTAQNASGIAVQSGDRIPEAGDGVAVEELGTLESRLESKTLDRHQTLWVGFDVAAAGPVRVEGISVTSSFVLRLFNEAGELIEMGTSGGSIASSRFDLDLQPGRYIVGLTNDDASDGLKMRQIKLNR